MISWKDFIINEWKSIVRSPLAGQNIGVRILWIILITLIVGQVSSLGFYLPVILRKELPDIEVINTINKFLWGYFLGDLIIRLILMNIPATIIHQYLHCNISRKKIANYLIAKSLFTIVNAVGISLWLSFTISNFGLSFAGISWFSGVVVLLCINTMLILFAATFQRVLFSLLFCGAVITAIGALEYFNIPVLQNSIVLLFTNLANGNFIAISMPFILLLLLFVIVRKRISSLMYFDLLNASKRKSSVDLSQISNISTWRFEWLLIYRNKRLRTMIILMYGVLGSNFLLQLANSNGNSAKPFPAILAFFTLSFYLFMFSSMWIQLAFVYESTFFDVLITLPHSWKIFLRRKYLISIGIVTLGAFVVTILDFFVLDMKYFSYILSLYIFHCGTSIFLTLYRSTLHRQRFEIETSAWFNYQGSSFTLTDLLILLNALVTPAIFFTFNKYQLSLYINPFLILIGGISLLFYRKWMSLIHESLLKRRYTMMEGFRAKL